ncbi:MAG: hypothetical protein LUJ09_03170 [Firmicutes bacterium]|nr:hypothetical protein [Bacillota bacterium]
MEQREYTRWEKFSNWFYYNKWWLLIGAIVLYVVGSMLWNVLGIGQTQPDYCVAYVGRNQLPEDCVSALQTALAALGEDVNGDGTVSVQITQHITSDSQDLENIMYGYASEVTVLADITQGESYFFLLDDPDGFQENFQILANLDGSIPGYDDVSGMDKVYAWGDCPVLAGLALGSYTDSYLDETETGQCQDLLSGLYLGRRYYADPDENAAQAANAQLWQRLTAGAEA